MRLSKAIADELISIYGSPLYVFHKDDFIENYNKLLNAIRNIYPKYNIAYSYKTNYTPGICKTVKELGGLAEVVSEMEYELAKLIGYKNDEIIYNGPVKGESLYEHLENGGVINIDNLDELSRIIVFANNNLDKEYKVAFRVNLDVGQGFISRFGVDTTNGDLDKAIKIVLNQKNLKLVGLHCHIGRSRGIDAWKKRVNLMIDLVDTYFNETPKFINLGSGMNSIMEPELAAQFSEEVPTYEEYADVIAGAMNSKYGNLPYEEQPLLLTEPGTTVISGYITFLAKVVSIKNIKGKNFAILDGSDGNIGDICRLKKLPVSVYSNGEVYKDVDFVGYTCLEHDVMYKGYSGKLSIGDIVEFRNVGSYSNVFKPPFILPNGAMIELNEKGQYKLLKRREVFMDIFHTYEF
jgi:diaminopimelate decarboxylase